MKDISKKELPVNLGQIEPRQYDIVVLVDSTLPEFFKCYESIKKNTSVEHTIAIVDTGSNDDELHNYYSVIEKDQSTVVLFLPDILGIVSAANLGMSYSDKEVVLLNSHVVVSPGWLEKLDEALFSTFDVGTATPWTNDETISSIFYSESLSPVQTQMTIDDLSEIAKEVCPGDYPQLPTVFGYCTAVKRDVINAVGLLDEEKYAQSSCAMKDFGMRCRERGYSNVLDDRSYIHFNTKVNGFEKEGESPEKALVDRHPLYNSQVDDFLKRDPLKHLRSRINRVIEDRRRRIHVLFVLHNDPIEGSNFAAAGSEKHVLAMADYFGAEDLIIPFILASNGKELSLLEKNNKGEWQRTRYLMPEPIWLTTSFSRTYKKRLHEILAVYHIDIVHYNHLFNHPLNLPETLSGWDGAVCITLHDHYVLSPCFHLVGPDGKHCKVEDVSNCHGCLKKIFGTCVDIDWWRKTHKLNLERMDIVYAPSESIAQIIIKTIVPSLRNDICIREHGLDLDFNQVREKRGHNDPPRIGFLGELSPHKGSKLIREIIVGAKEKEFDWFLIGEINDSGLDQLNQVNVSKTGRYDHGDLPELLYSLNLDLVILCSICAETFSYTLSESWGGRLPVLVGPLGAPADRVKKYGGGWIVDDLESASFLLKLREIFSSQGDYERKLSQVDDIEILKLEEAAKRYAEDYRKIAPSKQGKKEDVSKIIFWAGGLTDNSSDLIKTSKNSAELRGKIKVLEDNIQQGHKQIVDLYATIQRSQNDIQRLSERIKQLEAAQQQLHQAAKQQLEAAKQQLENTKQSLNLQLQQANLYIKNVEEQIAHLKNTLSWRMTAPLRKIVDSLRRLKTIIRETRRPGDK